MGNMFRTEDLKNCYGTNDISIDICLQVNGESSSLSTPANCKEGGAYRQISMPDTISVAFHPG